MIKVDVKFVYPKKNNTEVDIIMNLQENVNLVEFHFQ